MTQPTNIIRLGARLSAPVRTDDDQRQQSATPVVGPADRIGDPDTGADLTNVISFTPVRRDGTVEVSAPDLVLADDDRLARVKDRRDPRARIAALLLCSGLVHAGVLMVLNREPPPLASIGIEVISAELVLGANSATGPTPTDTEVQPQATAPEHPPEPTAVQPPEEKPEPTPPPMTEPAHQEAALPVPKPPPVRATREPTPAHPLAVAPPPPQETPPQDVAPKPERPPEPRKSLEHPRPKPAKPAASDQKHPAARPPRTDGRLAAREPAAAPGGVGPGRSDAASNYTGIAFAHLNHYQRLPAGVLQRGERKSATVRFVIDGNGRVSRIVLVRATGVASLDQEAQDMVRRASPFAPPPGALPITITAPVSFTQR
jgi:protein TonB